MKADHSQKKNVFTSGGKGAQVPIRPVASGNVTHGFHTAQRIKSLKKKKRGPFDGNSESSGLCYAKAVSAVGNADPCRFHRKLQNKKNHSDKNVPGGHINSCR